ncbi:hypothetical protein [Methanogenium sp. MK-MG]|uniref:hypothetical protein n=1 Tax=Methanogenium sp. MK-MG TaxID=2599926 RepID=UPI0013E9CDBC|nr:hypothetical protein [Methanogenium sp. MK-MG]KAF1078992.1 hypothetical protein MKMG_00135 [Methanogenium sp. MK-MG]
MHRMYKMICILCGVFLATAVPASAWTAGIDVTTDQTTFELEYGIEPNSTAQVDSDVDVIAPPPVPVMTKFAYFVTDGHFRELYTDVRPEAGWQLYIQSDEEISVTWDQPPVSLNLTPVSVIGSDVISRQAIDMSLQQSLSLVPGRHYIMITAAAAGSDPVDVGSITYRPPIVVTATSTQVPGDTPVPPTPVSTAVQTEKNTAATAAATAIPVPTGNAEPGMTVAVPANTTATPTQSPISAAIPFAGAGIFLAIYLRKQ